MQVGRCVFVPKGRRILAGGGTTGTAPNNSPSPEGATDQARSIAPSGLGRYWRSFPVVPPPANIRCASGTKTYVDGVGWQLIGRLTINLLWKIVGQVLNLSAWLAIDGTAAAVSWKIVGQVLNLSAAGQVENLPYDFSLLRVSSRHKRLLVLFVSSIVCAPIFAQRPAPIRAEPLYEQCASLRDTGAAAASAIATLKDKDAQKRVKAAETLAASCDARAVESLVAALKDPEVAVRVAAVQALGQLGDRSAIEPLIEAIGDEDWRVRAALGRTLCSFQAYASSNAALNLLANPGGKKVSDEGDLRARCQAILMVNQLRDVRFSRKAIGFLFGFLDYQDGNLRRIAQETALELKNTRNGFRELIGILKQSNFPDFRRKAIYYLGKYKIEETLPILTEISIEDRDSVVRKIAKEAVESRN